jgi:hypothetical protein
MEYDHDHENEITLFGETNFRNQKTRFGIKTDDRRRHVYVIGKTGMGKTTMLENMLASDLKNGHGCCLIDPHGDSAEKILDFIPANRVNDVVYFNPADMDYPIGFNILEITDPRQKHLVAAGLMGVFKKLWPDVWSSRMEYILLNSILVLLDYPGSTLLGINRLFVDKAYRKRVVAKCEDPLVKQFWTDEFESWTEKFRTEAVSALQNKVGQFLSASIIRNVVSQVRSTVDFGDVMNNRKIFIANLSKGRIGEDNMRLLGGMIITKFQLVAMERVNIPEDERQDFYMFVDEFQNFQSDSFAAIFSEARKYRLSLYVAHQYIEQLDENVRAAVFGNVGTLICFRIGGADSEFVESEFTPTFEAADFVNLTKYEIYLKLMIDGVASRPFSAKTLPPVFEKQGNAEKIIKVSRERYAEKREDIEAKVLRWSGMGPVEESEGAPENPDEERQERYAPRPQFSREPRQDGGPVRRSFNDGGSEGGDFRRPPMPQRDNYAPRRSTDGGGYDSRPPRRDEGFDSRPPRRDFGGDRPSRPQMSRDGGAGAPRRDFGDRPPRPLIASDSMAGRPMRRAEPAPRRDDFRRDTPPPRFERKPVENKPISRPEPDLRPQTPKIGSGDLVTKEPDEVEEVSLSRLLPKKE